MLSPLYYTTALEQQKWTVNQMRSLASIADILGQVILCYGAVLGTENVLQLPWPLSLYTQKCFQGLPKAAGANSFLVQNHALHHAHMTWTCGQKGATC